MKLSKKSKIGALLKEYPFLLDYLVEKSPTFSKLKSPIMRKTIGSIATLEQAAGMATIDLNELLLDIAKQIYRHTSDNVTIINPNESPEGTAASKEERIAMLKDIVMRLHKGDSVDEVRKDFLSLLHNVSPAEIGQMEQKLVADGIPETEIKKLCDLHVELFESTAAQSTLPELPAGHPLHSFQEENKYADEKARALLEAIKGADDPLEFYAAQHGIIAGVEDLSHIIRHYERKENQLFPIMERQGLTAPPQVMWELHDDIRALLKKARKELADDDDSQKTINTVQTFAIAVCDMIHKEENILFPMVFETFTDKDWAEVLMGESEIGYAWITPGTEWQPSEETTEPTESQAGEISLDRGELEPHVINAILKTLPVDLSFVDANDKVAYFSQTEERIFPRSAGIIGRDVSKCHPPKSVHVVEKILEAFKAGERDMAEFWLELNGVFIHIRYYAVRDTDGTYLGCLEVSQNVTDIRALTGEQRLLSWEK
ncbi:DUF438 domain-containing protein [Halodesulfovibrio marinisediminis]|uniref:PAC domain-containing protein n=1 Tax=Halodesulfovibrio marinisediminis DSM 17456 TaxID=1121457 RepID=A0A1N6I2Z5_9BACT|nr:DUF438 domain-containing protein [Halodesulfovibrio marinisediminis]SIO26359.1 hypothetical protein SAMN02745161_2371 [Halodesulfovibrio marinisediminis DSM 17456]